MAKSRSSVFSGPSYRTGRTRSRAPRNVDAPERSSLTAQALHERLTIVLTRRSTLLGLAAVSMVLFPSRDAPAHPRLLDILPADGAILQRCPERVLVRFSSEVDSHSTRVSVVGPSGSSSLTVEGSGAEPLRQLSIPVPDQGRGAYSVRWDITSANGERIRGRMRFVVRR